MNEGKRYIVCLNPDEACRDCLAREAVIAALEEKLTQGAGQLLRLMNWGNGARTVIGSSRSARESKGGWCRRPESNRHGANSTGF